MPEQNTRITFANRWTDRLTGEKYFGNDTIDIDAARARDLVDMGKARLAEPDAKLYRRGEESTPEQSTDQAENTPPAPDATDSTATVDAAEASAAPAEEVTPVTPDAAPKAARGRTTKNREA